MNDYTRYVEEHLSERHITVSRLNDIRKKFGRKEIKTPSKKLIKINQSYFMVIPLLCISIVLIFNFLEKKPLIEKVSIIRKENISLIDIPKQKLSIDEQSLYWTYAIYDFEMLKKTFSVDKDISLNQDSSRKNLITILPMVSAPTLEKIYTYDHEILNSIGKEIK